MMPKVCVLKVSGTNCDIETAYAFSLAGAKPEIVHINSLKNKFDPLANKNIKLSDFDILAVPGGFSYGDYIGAGKVLSLDLLSLKSEIIEFVNDNKLVIGICNGFQALVKAGLLPQIQDNQTVTLTNNDSKKFICRQVNLYLPENRCVWTTGIKEITLPIAHGEGKFIACQDIINNLISRKQIVFQYQTNPNGSLNDIAGICDTTGRILGLMPHPERLLKTENHYLFTLYKALNKLEITLGLKLFQNGVNYMREYMGAKIYAKGETNK